MSLSAARVLRSTYDAPRWVAPLVSSAAALLLAWTYLSHPLLAFLPAAALASLPLLLSPRARVLFVVFGVLAVFGSETLGSPKLLFLGGVTVAFGASLLRLPELSRTPAFALLKPLLFGSIVVFAMLAASLPVALAFDVHKTDWLRDVAPYVLFGCAPLFALEAADAFSAVALQRLLVIAGSIGALSFTIRWFANRGLADLGLAQFGLSTIMLAASVFVYGIAVLLQGTRKRLGWTLLTAVVFAMLISTGTRAAFVLLLAPVAVAVGSRRHLVRRSLRLAVAVPVAGALVFVILIGVVNVTHADRQALSRRASLLVGAANSTTTDQSYLDRLAQARSASELWHSSPLTGVGPGHPFPWSNYRGIPQPPKTVVDSPISYVAKFGVLGLVALALVVLGFLRTLRRLRLRTGVRTVPQLALIGYGAIIAGMALLVVPFEDKGMATALLLLVAIAAKEAGDWGTREVSS